MEEGPKIEQSTWFPVDRYDRLKVLLLSIGFFCIISSYTITKDLKDTVFVSLVGKEYIPWAKISAMLVLIPAIFLYSKLVDSIRRYQLLIFYSVFFCITNLFFALALGSNWMGLPNTDAGPGRLLGWLFYYFVEGYSPFLVSVFWAYANSITSPEGAKKYYWIIVSASKLGGLLMAGLAWFSFSYTSQHGGSLADDVFNHQIAILVASLALLCVPIVILLLMKKVPGRFLHGYEAAYSVEKEKSRRGEASTGIFSGLIMLFKNPYVLGIFGMVFFYESVSTVLSYLRLSVAESNSTSLSGVSSFLFQLRFVMHLSGLVISLLGTRWLLERLGERICLLLIPLISGLLLLYFLCNMSSSALIIAFVLLQSLNYAFSWPVRESLYIPTVKAIKFKSKSWIDAFGSKFAKASGSGINVLAGTVAQGSMMSFYSLIFGVFVGCWFATAYLLGKRFDWAVSHDEVIGAEE